MSEKSACNSLWQSVIVCCIMLLDFCYGGEENAFAQRSNLFTVDTHFYILRWTQTVWLHHDFSDSLPSPFSSFACKVAVICTPLKIKHIDSRSHPYTQTLAFPAEVSSKNTCNYFCRQYWKIDIDSIKL